jgi:hypothetical protein
MVEHEAYILIVVVPMIIICLIGIWQDENRPDFGTPPSHCSCGYSYAPGSIVRLSSDGKMRCCECGNVLAQ